MTGRTFRYSMDGGAQIVTSIIHHLASSLSNIKVPINLLQEALIFVNSIRIVDYKCLNLSISSKLALCSSTSTMALFKRN